MDSKRNLEEYELYKDIQARTGGEIYIGVVGPVRSGKSTFIKRFMDVCVLPNMEKEYEKKQAMDELPQSGAGKTITTTEPKFIPSEAAEINLAGDVTARVRLIDCVGYMVEGATGHMEEDAQRMVRTPWFDHEIPFTQAAELGTYKVIHDHSTIGIVVTTDGSFSEIPAENYEPALEKTLSQLAGINKPYVVLLNTEKPLSESAQRMAEELAEKYNTPVLPVNCAQLKEEDIRMIMQSILLAFPITSISFYMPKWVEMLPLSHPLKQEMVTEIKEKMEQYNTMEDILQKPWSFASESITKTRLDGMNPADGSVQIGLEVEEESYYKMLSDMLGQTIESEYELMEYLENSAKMQREYEKVQGAMESVRQKGYGVVTPQRQEITLEEPQIIHHGNKFGVKIRAQSPSIHMIRANIETEIAPIVGSKEQADDLIAYIGKSGQGEEGIWETNIFGKTIEQMVQDGISAKLALIGEESQLKLQDTMQKIVNDTNGGLVCIIL
jgi:stage IV sporulation protein A